MHAHGEVAHGELRHVVTVLLLDGVEAWLAETQEIGKVGAAKVTATKQAAQR